MYLSYRKRNSQSGSTNSYNSRASNQAFNSESGNGPGWTSRKHLFFIFPPTPTMRNKPSTYAVMTAMIPHQLAFKQRPLHIVLIILSVTCVVWVTANSVNSFSILESENAPSNKLQRVAKVSMLYGETNHMYERALQSHERHGKQWGYPMHILRQDISIGFWNKPSYLLSLVVNELTKPAGERMEWLMYVLSFFVYAWEC